jgi:hemoglobin
MDEGLMSYNIDQLMEPLGGEEGIIALVNHFYDAMDSVAEVKGIREMHPKDLFLSRKHLSDFLIFRFGGPPRYIEERGHPRMRARHFPFAIGEKERDQWLFCMDLALKKMQLANDLEDMLFMFFVEFAEKMRNR